MSLLTVGGKQIRRGSYERDLMAPWCQSLLARARATGLGALCHCTEPPRRLVVRRLRDLHFLASWPDDASQHDCSCRFHSSSKPGAGKQQPAAIQVDGPRCDGYHVALSLELTGRLEDATPPLHVMRAANGQDQAKRGEVLEPLQLLQYLWARARLNCWASGWSRDYWRVWHGLRHELALGRLNSGMSLGELVYVPRPFRRDLVEDIARDWADFSQVLCEVKGSTVHRRMVLGEARELQRHDGGFVLAIRHMKVKLHIRQETHDALYRTFSRAMSAIGKSLQHPSRVMVLAVVQPEREGQVLDVVDAGFMLCSSMWIPAATGYEVALANSLVEQSRSFEKPLPAFCEAADLPDYVLLDAETPTALEVFGLATLTYEERKFATISKLRSEGLNIWAWRAASSEAMPRLPNVIRR